MEGVNTYASFIEMALRRLSDDQLASLREEWELHQERRRAPLGAISSSDPGPIENVLHRATELAEETEDEEDEADGWKRG